MALAQCARSDAGFPWLADCEVCTAKEVPEEDMTPVDAGGVEALACPRCTPNYDPI
ncbi:hypothetical protein [Kitasatospora sp. NPDC056184]|uniref:hypothetical protein n=1 Tax=Kitasatospora sp. NPDC056184 TaxID=3345738 RepID=UPI0035DBB51A